MISLGDRRYRIRGLNKNLSYDQLKVNVLVNKGDTFHVDTLDIYSARHRASYIKQATSSKLHQASYIKQASIELGLKADIIKKDLGQMLLKI